MTKAVIPMKTLLIVSWVILSLLGTSTMAYAWWDNLEETRGARLTLGYGVRLSLKDETSAEADTWVPAGSFYAEVDGYTTSHVFTYVLDLEEDLDDFDLLIDVEGLRIGDTGYDPSSDVHGPMRVIVEFDAGENDIEFAGGGYDYVITGPNTHLRLNSVLRGDGEITVTITFTLLAQDVAWEYATAENLESAYGSLAGKTIAFDVAFEVPMDEETIGQGGFNVHP